MQSLWLPAIHAQAAFNRKNPQEALRHLQAPTGPIEFGQINFTASVTCLYPTYIRANAYLAANDGRSAAAEFQKITEHGGMVWNCWTGTLATLGLAREKALQANTLQWADPIPA